MALFAIWHDGADRAESRHDALLRAAHIVPQRVIAQAVDTERGRWQIAAFACDSHFYPADAQVWIDPARGACLIHGLVWRTGSGRSLDARAVGEMLGRPGAPMPDDVAGEYAIVRLHQDGTLEAFGDPAGLYQLFHAGTGTPIVANRAAFAALLADKADVDRDSGLWLGTIGYRVGEASGWAGIRQLGQGERLIADAAGTRIERQSWALPAARGFAAGGSDLLAQGLAEAKAAVRLAAGDGPVDLPITGGKDSRVVLAIALAAGLRERLTLFTRGYAGHPDVVVGERIAAELGLPHRREPPLGSDVPADLDPQSFLRLLGTIAFQADGAMGGWDNVTGRVIGRATLISGHLGEVLKAYAKRQTEGAIDGPAMVRLQAPFDPMELLHPQARARLASALERQMAEARASGATEDDLPDLFYWRNRVPNWLGGIRGIKAFERQPVLPLGVPALMRLAFTMTAAERKAELAHYKLIEGAAPELIDVPFAHQSWHPSLDTETAAPVLAAAGAPLFGSWQWSVNRVPAVRAALASLFAGVDIPLWEDVDRARLIDALHERRFDMFDLISLLGFAVAAIHQAGIAVPARLGEEAPIETAIDRFAAVAPLAYRGHLDAVRGAERNAEGELRLSNDKAIGFDGWLQCADWPGAAPVVEVRADGRLLAAVSADRPRPDLAAAGIGDGRHAFRLEIDAGSLDGASILTLGAAGSEDVLAGGRLAIKAASPDRSAAPSG